MRSRACGLTRAQWFKFDDERVTKEPPEAAIDQQFGGDDEPPNPGYGNFNYKVTRSSNAYMLVYVRISEKDHIMCPVAEEEIAEHLRARLKREADDKARALRRPVKSPTCDG